MHTATKNLIRQIQSQNSQNLQLKTKISFFANQLRTVKKTKTKHTDSGDERTRWRSPS